MTAAIFLAHGFASSSKVSWEYNGWLELLSEAGREVIAPDLLGHGEAAKPHDPAAYAGLEELAFAELAGVEEVDAIGFSMGARTALLIEVSHPGTFGRIVVGGLGNNLFTPEDPEPVALALEGLVEPTDPLVRAFVSASSAPPNDPLALAACLRGGTRNVVPADLATVSCPVLVAAGSKDVLVQPLEPLAAALEGSDLMIIPGVDHLGTMKDYRFMEAAFRYLGIEVV
jgi:pimeloyl-ACP methyl ester carboxylesterase